MSGKKIILMQILVVKARFGALWVHSSYQFHLIAHRFKVSGGCPQVLCSSVPRCWLVPDPGTVRSFETKGRWAEDLDMVLNMSRAMVSMWVLTWKASLSSHMQPTFNNRRMVTPCPQRATHPSAGYSLQSRPFSLHVQEELSTSLPWFFFFCNKSIDTSLLSNTGWFLPVS